jgi:tetratricopeptide (TPR) repeat protein
MLSNNLLHIKGNKLYKNKKYDEANLIYTLLLDNNYKIDIMYSNRAACFLKKKNYLKSLDDSLKAVQVNLNYSKAWARVAYSYKGLKMRLNSLKAFEIALKIDKSNKLYQSEAENYFNKFSSKLNIINLFSLLKDKNLINNLKLIKNDLLNTPSDKILDNDNIINFIDKIIDR